LYNQYLNRGWIIGLCWLITAVCFGQNNRLQGRIFTEDSIPLSNISLKLKGTSYQTISDSNGSFSFPNIPPGKYKLIAADPSSESLVLPVEVKEGQNSPIIFLVKQAVKETEEVVITATRTEKDVADVPTPIKVIPGTQIRQMGSLRLNEVLQEQTGLAVVSDAHDTGIQMQGFNPDYTMILLNGEPVIGRTAGTLDLTRFAVGNIKKIEIVKGPSSSLYGSEALAGIINIITEKPKEGFSTQLKQRYSTGNRGYNVFDLTGDVSYRYKKAGIYFFANRYQSMGYDLQPETPEKTVPPFNNYTLQTRINYDFSSKTNLVVNARYFSETSNGNTSFSEDNITYKIYQKGSQYDWNLNPVFTHRCSPRLKQTIRYYATQYYTNSEMTNLADGSLYDKSFFNQTFNRPETQVDYLWTENQQTTAGTGVNFESVNSTRYTEGKKFYNIYGYLQHDFTLFKRLSIIAGARLDDHSVYGKRISPKLSSLLKVNKWLSLKASAGEGFKAPDFRQLYLNFSNPVAGYSVFGSEEVKQQVALLQQKGQISQILMDINSLQSIRAEYSTAYNLGFVVTPHKRIQWSVNFFYNDIKDLIETGAVAIKSNGQSVYTYFNQSNVFTRGLETDLSLKLLKNFSFSAGYQYLEAKNKKVLDDIEAGKYFARNPVTLETTKLTKADYGGLFNRSKHMANARLFYMNPKTGWGGNIRCIYRGRYGFGDLNGNNILDDGSEYVKGYFLWNLSLSKKIYKRFTVQGGIDNLFDYTNPVYITSIPGRIYYLSLQIEFAKK